MSSTRFVHLRLHSEFSVVDGIVRIDEAIKKAARDGQGALALTDSANIFGAVRFYAAARKKGVKPIIGCDLWITNDADRDNPFRLAVLVQDRAGYLNLCDLLTRAYLENQHRNRAEVRLEWFEERDGRLAQGLIALSGGRHGDVGASLLAGKIEPAKLAAQRMAAAFPGRYFLELHRTGHERDAAQTRAALALGAQTKLPVVATHPIQFLEKDDFRPHEARVCIAEGYTLADPRRPRRYTEQQYFKTQAEMERLVQMMPVADAGQTICVVRGGREDVLPGPLPVGARVLAGDGVRQGRAAEAVAQVVSMELADLLQVFEKLRPAAGGQRRNAILLPLAVPHGDLVALEVNVLDTHVQALEEPQPAAVQEGAHEQHDAVQLGQHLPHLAAGQDDWHPARPLGAHEPLEQADVALQDVPVQEDQGAQGLGLCRGADALLHREVRQERVELLLPHVGGVADPVEEDVAPDPVHVGLLGSLAVVARPNRLANPVEELRLGRHDLSLAVPSRMQDDGRTAWRIDGHRGMPSVKGDRRRPHAEGERRHRAKSDSRLTTCPVRPDAG